MRNSSGRKTTLKGRHARMAPLKISSLVTRKKTGTVKKANCTILNLVNLEIRDITKTTSWSILRHIPAIENKPAHQNIIFIMQYILYAEFKSDVSG